VTPAEFRKNVATPNADALGNNFGDMCLAVNAILALDALVGIIHADRHQRGLESADDIAFRDKLAAKHVEYALVRDAAFALKHGELRGKKPRLVQRADQVTSYGGAFDEAIFDRSAFDTEAVIWIEANDPAHSRRADTVTRAVLDILETIV
jgi:hypothetical protein